MRQYGVDRQVLDRRQVLAIEPALAGFAGLTGARSRQRRVRRCLPLHAGVGAAL